MRQLVVETCTAIKNLANIQWAHRVTARGLAAALAECQGFCPGIEGVGVTGVPRRACRGAFKVPSRSCRVVTPSLLGRIGKKLCSSSREEKKTNGADSQKVQFRASGKVLGGERGLKLTAGSSLTLSPRGGCSRAPGAPPPERSFGKMREPGGHDQRSFTLLRALT